MKVLAVIGAGGHARSALNLLKKYSAEYEIRIYDDCFASDKKEYIHDAKLCGKIDDIPTDSIVFLAVGDNKKREQYFAFFKNRIITDNLLHEKAFKENFVQMGASNQILAGAYLNSYVEIGNDNIINSSAVLEHEVKIGSHNHVSVGAKLCGRVKIGSRCFIGAGSVIIDKVSICDDVIAGAGSVIIKNITESGTYVGNPARKVK